MAHFSVFWQEISGGLPEALNKKLKAFVHFVKSGSLNLGPFKQSLTVLHRFTRLQCVVDCNYSWFFPFHRM